MCRGLMGRDNELHIRQQRGVALAEADLVIMAGVVADFRLDYGRHLFKRSKSSPNKKVVRRGLMCGGSLDPSIHWHCSLIYMAGVRSLQLVSVSEYVCILCVRAPSLCPLWSCD